MAMLRMYKDEYIQFGVPSAYYVLLNYTAVPGVTTCQKKKNWSETFTFDLYQCNILKGG